MKIEIEINEKYQDTNIKIQSPYITSDIEKIISMIRMLDQKITVKMDDETFLIDVGDVFYIESVDRSTFFYTSDKTYEADYKLYELEQQLMDQMFIRANKSIIVNLRKIKSLKSDINRKIRITMINGEQIIVSRNYAEELRNRLGVK